ncbi:MAG: fibrobacter succinogenes major paralogous domain-containing protein [Prolixibacteraceae bacterium]|nr:fibrobacter succinogenes major paralogous domain-containing protein [Prolixibacteraceae bacterium]
MKTNQFATIMLLLVFFLTNCNKDNDKEYGTLVFKGVSELPDLKSEEFCFDGLNQPARNSYVMHTTDIFVNIAEIWATQGLVAEGLQDNFTWYLIGSSNQLQSVSQYLFTTDHLPAGDYKSLKMVFRNEIIRKTVFQSDHSKAVDMQGSLNEAACGNSELIVQYFSKNGNHSLRGSTFHCDAGGENIRGFKIKPNETTTVYWQLGSPGFKLTDCWFTWLDYNNNEVYDCGNDQLEGFDCNKSGPMWSFGIDDGEEDPFILNAATDIDGNSYNAVKIGNQIWLNSNLKTTRLNDGTPILSQQNYQEHCDSGFCPPPNEELPPLQYAYPNKQEELVGLYGLYYNWMAVETGKLCPQGWHIPSKAEWDQLINFLGDNAGGKLKIVDFEPNPYNWQTPNVGATNEYGFDALPAGGNMGPSSGRMELNVGYGINALFFTSSNEADNPMMPKIPIYVLSKSSGDITSDWASYDCFMSCRCIKNE